MRRSFFLGVLSLLAAAALSAAVSRDGRTAYIVVLKDAPLARAVPAGASKAAVRAMLTGRDGALAERSRRIDAAQEAVVRQVKAIPGVVVGARYKTVLNGFAVLAPAGSLSSLAGDPRVRAVYPVRQYHLRLDASNPAMNAPAFWDSLGGDSHAGTGVRIADLDTGIDFSNPMFSDPSLPMPAGFPRENDGNGFANSKVIVAKYFQSVIDSSDPTMNPGHRTAQDLSGHGSHTAGVAAGAQVTLSGAGRRAVTLEGVAPKAYLGDYRVFSPDAYSDNIIAAIDEAVADGMDVLNMSFGENNPDGTEPFHYGDAIENEAIQSAIAAGVVVTISAGNSGIDANLNPVPDSIGAAANVPDVISVGASTNTHDGFSSDALGLVSVTAGGAPPPATLSHILGTKGTEVTGGFPDSTFNAAFADWDNFDSGAAGLACDPVAGTPFNGQIVLIQRGTCTFVVKVNNAAAAGARAVVVYNSQERVDAEGDNFFFAKVQNTGIPAIFIRRADGLALKSYLDANAGNPPSARANFGPATGEPPFVIEGLQAHDLADFSSIGPTLDLQIKPDLTTVGTGSYAPVEDDDPLGEGRFPAPDPIAGNDVALYDPSGFTFSAGTSFSAPRTAGAAALLVQKHPDWTPAQVKAALMETATRPTDATDAARIGNLSVMQRGSGDIDLAAAAGVSSVVLPASYSFRKVVTNSLPFPGGLSTSFTIQNTSDAPATYTLQAAATLGDPAVVPSISPGSLTVAAHASATFTLTLSPGAALQTGEHDSEGFVSATDGGATIPGALYVPYWIRLAYQNGSSPVLETLAAQFDAATPTTLDIDFSAHDSDGDIASFIVSFFDSQDNSLGSAAGDFGGSLDGKIDVAAGPPDGEIQATGADPASCPDCSTLTLELFDSRGNASGTLFARFGPAASGPVPNAAGSSQKTVPLVAHATGSKFFQSDARIFNPSTVHLMPVDIYFVPQGQSGASALHTTHVVAPRQTLALDDLVLNDFGQSQAVGDLVLTSDGGSFVATSRAYTRDSNGTYGTFAAALPSSAGIGAGTSADANGLPTATGFHTNIGATETAGVDTSVRFDGYDADGVSVGSFTDTVPSHSNHQFNDPVASGRFTMAASRVEFTVVSGGRVLPYASVVDDGSGDGFLSLAKPAQAGTDAIFVTEVAHVHGANNTLFTSDVSVSNLGDSPASFTITLLPNFPATLPTTPQSFTLQPHQTGTYPDILSGSFGVSDDAAAGLLVAPDGPSSLLVSARTSTPNAPGAFGTYGFFVLGEQASAALGSGGRAVSIQLAQDAVYRTNFGFAEVTGQSVTVRATFLDDFGTPMGSRAYTVSGHTTFQANVRDLIGDASVANGVIEFTIDSGSGRVLPFAAVVDAGTGDAIYVAAESEN
jgi:minor extracellular serine protease Vpr